MGELDFLIKGISSVTWQQLIMYAVGAILIIIGIAILNKVTNLKKDK